MREPEIRMCKQIANNFMLEYNPIVLYCIHMRVYPNGWDIQTIYLFDACISKSPVLQM